MFTMLVSIYLRQFGAVSADDVNLPGRADEPREGDQFERAFHQTLSFRSSADANILRDIFALFNGEGTEHPASTVRLPRSLSAGDIIVGLDTVAFLVTEDGFRALAFSPRGEHFEVTAEQATRKRRDKRKEFHPLRPEAGDEAARQDAR